MQSRRATQSRGKKTEALKTIDEKDEASEADDKEMKTAIKAKENKIGELVLNLN